MMEGALAIQEGQNPNLIAEKLSNLGPSEDPGKKADSGARGVPVEAR
jgi:flagellar motor component MotA